MSGDSCFQSCFPPLSLCTSACHWMEWENRHVWISFALCTCLREMLLGPVHAFCVCAPDWAWQLCSISCYRTQLHRQRKEAKHQMLWLNSPSKPLHSHSCHVKLISQWADLITQMLLLQVSSPSSEDCLRHKAREAGLGGQCFHAACDQRHYSSSVPERPQYCYSEINLTHRNVLTCRVGVIYYK